MFKFLGIKSLFEMEDGEEEEDEFVEFDSL